MEFISIIYKIYSVTITAINLAGNITTIIELNYELGGYDDGLLATLYTTYYFPCETPANLNSPIMDTMYFVWSDAEGLATSDNNKANWGDKFPGYGYVPSQFMFNLDAFVEIPSAGEYTFAIYIGWSRMVLFIDGSILIDSGPVCNTNMTKFTKSKYLSKGMHNIRVNGSMTELTYSIGFCCPNYYMKIRYKTPEDLSLEIPIPFKACIIKYI